MIGSTEFRILSRIAADEGQSSTLYRVQHALLGRVCVAKLLNLAIHKADGTNPLQEARILESIAHPLVCAIYDAAHVCMPELAAAELRARPDLGNTVGLEEGPTHLAILMPEYTGGTLASRLKAGPLIIRDSLPLLLDSLEALSACHRAGALHLDLKPTNLLLRTDGRTLLADFGQASLLGPNGKAPAPRYPDRVCMPPEYYSQSLLTLASDVYVAGAFAYRLLNGESLWHHEVNRTLMLTGLPKAICAGTFPDRSLYLPHVPQKLASVVTQAMHVDPAQRFPSSAAFADALSRVEADLSWSGEQTGLDRYRIFDAASSLQIERQDNGWLVSGSHELFITRQDAFQAVSRGIR